MPWKQVARYLVWIIPPLFLLPVIYALFQPPLYIFPWRQKVYRTDAYADSGFIAAAEASSVDNFTAGVDSIVLAYTLREGVEYPYAGFYFATDANDAFLDLSGYDYLKIKIAVSSRDIYQIKIKTHINGHTIAGDSNTRCPLEKALVLEDFMQEYRIPLQEFEFLDWWFQRQQLDASGYKTRDLLAQTASINLQQTRHIEPGIEVQGRFVLKQFSFHKDYILLHILCGTGCLVSACLAGWLEWRLRRWTKQSQPVRLPEYNPVKLGNYTDEDTERLVTFIMENYADPGISVELLYHQTGIPRRRIGLLIRQKHNCSCKQLVNKIRLTEAARLLRETDRNITEIAIALGFSSSAYFFQVFKRAYNISPSDFRKQQQAGK